MLRIRYAGGAGRLGHPRHRARRRLRTGGAFGAAASPRWKATWAWSKSASGLLPGGGGLDLYRAPRRRERRHRGERQRRPARSSSRKASPPPPRRKRRVPAPSSRARSATCCRVRHRSSRTRTNCCTSPPPRSRAMYETGYRPPVRAPDPRRRPLRRSRRSRRSLVAMRDGEASSAEHDFHIGALIADVCLRRRGRRRHAGDRGVPDGARASSTSARSSRTRRRRNASWACCRPASPFATEPKRPNEHEQANPRRLHRRCHPHADRQVSGRGYFRNTRPDDLLVSAIQAARWPRCPALDPKAIEDAIVGCAMPEGEQGLNFARTSGAAVPACPKHGGRHHGQPFLRLRPVGRCRWRPTASASAKPT